MYFKKVCILIAVIIAGLVYSDSGYAAVGKDSMAAQSSQTVYGKTSYQNGDWVLYENALNVERDSPSHTKLANGRILVMAGSLSNVPGEIFDPSTNAWTVTSSMVGNRAATKSAVLLDDGTVLIAGAGDGPNIHSYRSTSEIFDPETGLWTASGNLVTPMMWAGAVKLNDGRVLIMGDRHYPCCDSRNTAQIYDPASKSWSYAASMISARQQAFPVLLDDGRVLLCGSRNITSCCVDHGSISAAEVYDPVSGSWQSVPDMSVARYQHTVTKLKDGRVFVAGGWNNFNSCEIYNPQTNTWQPAASMTDGRNAHSAVLLNNGCVVVVGGRSAGNASLNTVEMYDPDSNQWIELPPMAVPRSEFPVLEVLDDGRIIVANGYDGSKFVRSMEILTPEQLSLTVTFAANENCRILDGGAAAVQSVAPGGSAVAPDVAADEGYYFMGWDVSFDNVTSDITVTAVTRERFNGKDGSAQRPLEILLSEEFIYLTENPEHWDNHIMLTDNLDLGKTILTPIGSANMPFYGVFNGCGHTIKDFKIVDSVDGTVMYEFGLFGVIGSTGVVKNIGLLQSSVFLPTRALDAGILAGQNRGTVRYCFTEGTVDGWYVTGGLVGYNSGLIEDCYSLAKCSGQYFVGGLVGENAGTIKSSYALGECASQMPLFTGALVGINRGELVLVSNFFEWDYVMDDTDGRMDAWQRPSGNYPTLFWQSIRGDIDYNESVDIMDLMIVAQWWLLSDDALDEGIRLRGDINLDGRVDMLDFVEIVKAVAINN